MMFDILTTISAKFNEENLKECLESISECDEVIVKSIESRDHAGTKGDSYLSTLYRFTVSASGKIKDKEESICLQVIAKGIPKNVARRKTFRSFDFFETEIYFYNKVWPLMKKLKDQKNIKEPDEVPFHLLSYSDGVNDFICLKDLSFEGYGTIQRDHGLNKEFASPFLKLLANFHALSIAARHLNPEFENIANSLKETYFDERLRSWYIGFLEKKLYEVVRNAVKTQLEPSYLEKLNKLFSSDLFGILCKLTKAPSSKLLGVVQGDAWIPNFLLKTREGRPEHALLIDFQLARYSSVTGDLVHFLYCCISQEVLLNHWDDLIKEYHTYLSKRIAELGCSEDLITLEDLKEDIEQNCLIGFFMAMESTVMATLEENEVPDLDAIQGEDAVPLEVVWDISPFNDVPRNKRIAFLIKHAVDKGFI